AVVGIGGLLWNCVSPARPASAEDIMADRSVAALLLSLFAGFVLFYSLFENWMGGRSYGPRYLVPILPLVGLGIPIVLARVTNPWARRAMLALVTVSVLVQVPGVLVDYAKASQASSDRINASIPPDLLEGRSLGRQWRWDASPLVLNAAMLQAV